MPIDLEKLRECTNTADARTLLRVAFRESDYEGVYDGIVAMVEAATVNRSQVKSRLFSFLAPFASNFVIAKKLGAAPMEEWEDAFPDLLQAVGVAREDTWSEFLLDRATFRREGLREALSIIERTITRFLADR
jgi:hypothetical protein